MVQKWQWKIYRMRVNFDWKCCEMFVVWNIVEKDKHFVKLSRIARNNNLRLIEKSSFLQTYVRKHWRKNKMDCLALAPSERVCVWIAWQKIHTMHKCVMKWIDIDRMPNQCVIKLMCEIREKKNPADCEWMEARLICSAIYFVCLLRFHCRWGTVKVKTMN